MQEPAAPGTDPVCDAGGDAGGIQVIARAGAILRLLAEHPAGLSLGAIARGTALPRSTVQRIVAALEAEQLAQGGAEGVRLGPALPVLAAAARPSLAEELRPRLLALSRALGECVVLCRARGRESGLLLRILAETQELRVVPPDDVSFPLSCTANGKALLALMEDAAVARRLGPELPRLTPASPRDLPALLEELAAVRRTGLAYDLESHSAGICAIAVARPGPEPHSVAVVVPAVRFALQRARVEEALLEWKEEK
ncbi:helix-turn-helix domain-containing protein [Roseomonas sp. GC11]|uniref:IclR family transcriptional regulator n=1 Tax=Roseomonas sp. GC11 TaxID=2950546 RepID=UPI0021095DF8|nr:IclR family transcriptional regulator C-terminal domain-containing protein [Roseomonas sp. GC11]MCQ4162716.1 helix-turn-helix domain-containing protein [Roseomonas sp. GC11]